MHFLRQWEKSFVTPFLFDIKRSEVQGPILQFQSTIFQKNDIKKMVQTLNKACGDAGISEQRLDKSFDVWYPTLEQELIELKDESSNKDEDVVSEDVNHSSEILEEILDFPETIKNCYEIPMLNCTMIWKKLKIP